MPLSRNHGITRGLDISGGTKSLTNSPLLLGKTRRGVSAVYGNAFHTRNSFSNTRHTQQGEPDISRGDFKPNQLNQAAPSDHFMPSSRHRRLSGSQQNVMNYRICI